MRCLAVAATVVECAIFLCERGVPLLVATTLAAWRHQSRQWSSTHGECDSWRGFGREPPRQTVCHKPCAKRVVTCECVWLGWVGKGPIKACMHSPAPCCVVCQVDCHNIPAIVQPQFHVGYEWLDACCAAQSKSICDGVRSVYSVRLLPPALWLPHLVVLEARNRRRTCLSSST